jgi:hypothetical protein
MLEGLARLASRGDGQKVISVQKLGCSDLRVERNELRYTQAGKPSTSIEGKTMPKQATGTARFHRGGWDGAIILTGRRFSVRGATEEEVSQTLAELRQQHEEGEAPDLKTIPSALTLSHYLTEIWLTEIKPVLKPATFASGIDLLAKFQAEQDDSRQVRTRFTAFTEQYLGLPSDRAQILYCVRNALMHTFGLNNPKSKSQVMLLELWDEPESRCRVVVAEEGVWVVCVAHLCPLFVRAIYDYEAEVRRGEGALTNFIEMFYRYATIGVHGPAFSSPDESPTDGKRV